MTFKLYTDILLHMLLGCNSKALRVEQVLAEGQTPTDSYCWWLPLQEIQVESNHSSLSCYYLPKGSIKYYVGKQCLFTMIVVWKPQREFHMSKNIFYSPSTFYVCLASGWLISQESFILLLALFLISAISLGNTCLYCCWALFTNKLLI